MLGISKYVVPFESIKRIVITNVESNPGESLLENFQPTETFHSEGILQSRLYYSLIVIEKFTFYLLKKIVDFRRLDDM